MTGQGSRPTAHGSATLRRGRWTGAVAILAVALMLGGCQGRGWCVAEGTMVATPNGAVPVEMLVAGRAVIAARIGFDSEEPASVVALQSRIVGESRQLVLTDGRRLRITAGHPVATDAGWRKAGRLRAGDAVHTDTGPVQIERIERLRGPVRVYNLTVAPHETYYANGVLVHNKTIAVPADETQFVDTVWLGLSTKSNEVWRMELREGRTAVIGRGRGWWAEAGDASWRLEKRAGEGSTLRVSGEFDVSYPRSGSEFAEVEIVAEDLWSRLGVLRARLHFPVGFDQGEILLMRESEWEAALPRLRAQMSQQDSAPTTSQ